MKWAATVMLMCLQTLPASIANATPSHAQDRNRAVWIECVGKYTTISQISQESPQVSYEDFDEVFAWEAGVGRLFVYKNGVLLPKYAAVTQNDIVIQNSRDHDKEGILYIYQEWIDRYSMTYHYMRSNRWDHPPNTRGWDWADRTTTEAPCHKIGPKMSIGRML
jgi:hypothetical protein